MKLDWSIFHNSVPSPAIMKLVTAAADQYGVEGFEMCGECHCIDGGLDGCLMYEKYPSLARGRNKATVEKVRKNLNEVVSLCHKAGRPIIYWHREVMVPAGAERDLPGIFDENGEVDFNADPYYDLLREKIREFFRAVPGMDGIVLTLTEAQYSVIHNSDQLRYPPVDIAERILRTFAEELKSLKKQFVFRSFGSIHEDYRILCAAADRVSKDTPVEVETKITPFDWSLFLPDNPYLVKPTNGRLSAEFDLAGEFVGESELPYLNPDHLVRQGTFAIEHGCDRLAPRIDRRGNHALGSLSEINIYTISALVKNPKITADEIWAAWADIKWGGAAPELLPIMKRSIEMLKKSFYIDGHLFSQHPVPSIFMMMLGGIFAVFQPGVPLDIGEDLWSMISTKKSPSREQIVREKEAAVALADQGADTVAALVDKIPADQFPILRAAWLKSRHTTRAHLNMVRTLIGYFEDMAELQETPHRMLAALNDLVTQADQGAREFPDGIVAEFAKVMRQNAEDFQKYYAAELLARQDWGKQEDIMDLVICGGFTDEYRLKRYMHGSAVEIVDGRPVRHAGNRVFPNGYLEYVMKTDPAGSRLLLQMHGKGGRAKVSVDGRIELVSPPEPGFGIAELSLPEGRESVRIRIEKAGAGFPVFGAIAVRKD